MLVQVLIREFSKTHQIYLLSHDDPGFISNHEIGNFLAGHLMWAPPEGPPRLAYLSYARQIARKIEELGIGLVHFHSGFFNWGNRFFGYSLPGQLAKRGIPSVWTMHGSIMILRGHCSPKLPRAAKLLLFVSAWFGKLSQVRNTACEVLVSETLAAGFSTPLVPGKGKSTAVLSFKTRSCNVPCGRTTRWQIENHPQRGICFFHQTPGPHREGIPATG